jgi:hypothetical protein
MSKPGRTGRSHEGGGQSFLVHGKHGKHGRKPKVKGLVFDRIKADN